MFAIRKPLSAVTTLSVVALLFVGAGRASAEFEFDQQSDPNAEIETLTVRITVDAEGEDLAEPVALDIGLGFPLWMHPLGRSEDQTALFGAVPQRSTANETARAGSHVEFTFELAGEAGQDVLQTSSQLLAGARVSDISRIGLISRGESNWVLAAYEIEINGRTFAANDEVNASVDEQQEAARTRLGEVNLEISPLETEAEDIRMLVEAGLATNTDVARLEEIDEALVPLAKERNRLERQLEGSYPWYEESAFESPWRTGEAVQEVRVTLVTAAHAGADTRNYVYYRTGGHKYLLSSPINPLTPESGLRVLRLDLVGGPLTTDDVRGHALGMLAHANPYGEAPDRWHPERLLVEVNGSAVYDSDQIESDRRSLMAIRIVPPAHFDETGNLVANEPVERETYVWEAGTEQGLDLAGEAAAALPDPGDEAFPEPGLPYDEQAYASAEHFEGFEDGFQPFPGEASFDDEWDVAGDDGYYDDDNYDDGYYDNGYCGGGGGWEPAPNWLAFLLGFLVGLWAGDDPTDPDPFGDPPQIDNVRIVGPPDNFQIQWEVTGDTSNIASFRVELQLLLPHKDVPIVGSAFEDDVPAGWRSVPVDGSAALSRTEALLVDPDDLPLTYWLPVVRAQFHAPDPEVEEPSQAGPARAAQPGLPLQAFYYFGKDNNGGPIGGPLQPRPEWEGRAVWFAGRVDSHIGYEFELPSSGLNLVLRPEAGDLELRVPGTASEKVPDRRFALVAHAGFVGSSEIENNAQMELWRRVHSLANPPDDADEQVAPSSLILRMEKFRIPFDANVAFPGDLGPFPLDLKASLINDVPDLTCPPAFFGLRVVPLP